MKLNCETILDSYTHESKTILCQIKVQSPLKDDKRPQFRESKNTCRCSLTREQWKTFDKELEALINIHNFFDGEDEWDEDKLCKFNVQPNIEVRVRQSKVSINNFYEFLDVRNDIKIEETTDDKTKEIEDVKIEETPDDKPKEIKDVKIEETTDDKPKEIEDVKIEETTDATPADTNTDVKDGNIKQIVYVLECILEYKHQTSISPLETDEYLPEFFSPIGYEPYTPSKKNHSVKSTDHVKTPGLDFLGYTSNEDENSPTALSSKSPADNSETSNSAIPKYKPGLNRDQRTSKDSQKSYKSDNENQVVLETEDELSPYHIPARIRNPRTSKDSQKSSKSDYKNKVIETKDELLSPKYKTALIRDQRVSKDSIKSFKSDKINEVVVETEDESLSPNHKPAPVRFHRTSKDSQKSYDSDHINEIIVETEEELLSPQKYKSIRSKIKKKTSKDQEICEKLAETKTNKQQSSDTENETKSKKECTKDKNLLITPDKKNPQNTNDDLNKHKTKKTQQEVKEKICKKLDYNEMVSPTSKEKKNLNVEQEKKLKKKFCEIPKKSTEKSINPLSSDDEFEGEQKKKESPKLKIKSNESKSDSEFESTNIKIKKTLGEVVTISSTGESSTTDTTSPPKKKAKEKHIKLNRFDPGELRRSRRSPTKPNRLIYEQTTNDNKTKAKKPSPSKHDLFGTDDDDDENDNDDFENNNNGDNNNKNRTTAVKLKPPILHTPKCEKPHKYSSSSSSSTKKKRKRDNSECEQEKRDIGKWLGKNKSNSDLGASTSSSSRGKLKSSKSSRSPPPLKLTKKLKSLSDDKKVRQKSETPPPTPVEFVMPSKEELEEIRMKTKLQHENNEKLKAELEKVIKPPPKEVKILSLKDMSVTDLLATLDEYKPVLDDIYEKNSKKDHIKGHDGINHCFIISLMEGQTQYKMLQKLSDVYSSNKSTTQATLYANAMFPEWIIRVFMKKFNFTREEALNQIKAQEDYKLHLDEQNDISLTTDDIEVTPQPKKKK